MAFVFFIFLSIVMMVIVPLLIIALFVPKKYFVEREIIINKQRQEVFDYIRFLKNQEYYSKWVMADPDMKKNFKGTDGSVGFIYGWNGNNQVGEGEQELKKINDGESIEMEIRFVRPFAGIGNACMITEAVSGDQTKVKWGMKGESNYPMNLMNLFTNKMLGKDLIISLNSLKGVLEKNK
jgi:hypothetical protein